MSDLFTCNVKRPMAWIASLFLFFSVFFFSCDSEDYGLMADEQALSQEAQLTTTNSDVLATCTDVRAINTGYGASFDDNSCQYTPMECTSCDFTVRARDKVIDNDWIGLPPGSVIGIQAGGRTPLIFRNFHGTADNPYIFINCGGQVKVTGDLPGIKLHNCSHIRLTGTGSTDDYGIVVSGTRPFGVVAELGTTDFEIDHLEVKGTKSVAIAARTRPVCDGSTNRGTFVQRNSILHHNYIHDVGDEAFYVGGSHWHTSFPTVSECSDLILYEPELEGVRIYNNYVENTGRDGIQVGSATKDCEIYNNTVINYGVKNITIHQAGIQINPGTTGKIYNNLIKGGTGRAIFLNGFDNDVYNNLIIDCVHDAIHIGDRNPPAGQSYRIVNNTMINIKGYGVMMNSKLSTNNIFYNNVLVNTEGAVHKMASDMDFDIENNKLMPSAGTAVFADPTNLDFTPVQGSTLIDVGVDLNTIDNFNVIGDYMLHQREVGNSVDIGAFEYQNN